MVAMLLVLAAGFSITRGGSLYPLSIATLPLAFSVGLRRMLGTWTRHVDAFIALTDFQRDRMIAAGLPAELVHVKPNFYPGNPTPVPWAARRPSVVFAGRLTAAKGVMALRPQRRRVRASES